MGARATSRAPSSSGAPCAKSPRRRAHLRRLRARVEPGAQPHVESRAALPPVWVDVVEKVETDVATLERALKSLKEAHRARLMVSFDESREAELDREIERQSQNATQLFRACEKTLKRVLPSRRRRGRLERKVRANVQRSVAVRIQALNTEFRTGAEGLCRAPQVLGWRPLSLRLVRSRRWHRLRQIWFYRLHAIDATT